MRCAGSPARLLRRHWLARLPARGLDAGVAQGVIAFFHPNASGGGGGERVLWCAPPLPLSQQLDR